MAGPRVVQFPPYALRYEVVDSTTSYLGVAEAGEAEGSAVWQVRRLVFSVDGDVTITWADGDSLFDNVWTNRASLTYV